MILGYRFYATTTAAATEITSNGTDWYWPAYYTPTPEPNVLADIKRALQLLRSRAWPAVPTRERPAPPPKKHLGASAFRWGWPPLLRAPPQ